jgi:hypothetical protein
LEGAPQRRRNSTKIPPKDKKGSLYNGYISCLYPLKSRVNALDGPGMNSNTAGNTAGRISSLSFCPYIERRRLVRRELRKGGIIG